MPQSTLTSNSVRLALQGSVGAVVALTLTTASHAQIAFESPEATLTSFTGGMTVADIDQDGRLDVVKGDSSGGQVLVHRNLGGCNLAPGVGAAAGTRPGPVVADDFTGDGWVDVVSSHFESPMLSLLVNNGSGTLLPSVTLPAFLLALQMGSADLNEDGRPDLVVRYEDYPASPWLSLHFNQGGGAFLPPVSVTHLGWCTAFALADIDGDGPIDIVFVGGSPNRLQYLRNLGGGSFAPPAALAPDSMYISSTTRLLAADLDGDDDIDLACTVSGGVRYYENLGGAVFATFVTIPNPGTDPLSSLRCADMDGDGNKDLVIAPLSSSVLYTYSNLGAGPWTLVQQQPTLYRGYAVLADMDTDGDVDFVVPSAGGGSLIVHPNSGDGTYSVNVGIPAGNHQSQATKADLNGDPYPDLISAAGGLNVVLGTGPESWAAPVFYDISGIQRWATSGDLDGDGDEDVVTANSTSADVAVLLNQGGGALAAPVYWPTSLQPRFVACADLDEDGDLDLVALGGSTGLLVILFNAGGAAFGAPVSHSVGSSPVEARCADLDGDGDLDIATVNNGSNSVSILPNLGGGTFAPATTLAAGTEPSAITSGDIDGDGDVDLAVCNRGLSGDPAYTVNVYRNSGAGTFTRSTLEVGGFPSAIACAELDGVPGLELFTANENGNTVSVLRNLGNMSFAPRRDFFAGSMLTSLTTLDADGDGDTDVLVSSFQADVVDLMRNARVSGTPYCAGDGTTIPCPCGNHSAVGANAGCTNSTGVAGVLRGSGSAVVSDDELVLSAHGLTGSVALFFQGTIETPPVVLDDGIGCVGGSIVRLGSKPVSAGTSSYPLPGDPLVHTRGAIPAAGATRAYQCFYRNAVGSFCPPATSNRTNALRLIWHP